MQNDEFGRHEVLDRSSLLMSMVDEWLIDHAGLEEDEMLLAIAAHKNLFDLYQLVGERTLK